MINPTLSIVIPCYNEAESIPHLLRKYREVIGDRSDIEVIMVNDGSKDNTKEILGKERSMYPFLRTIDVYPNGGYGNAIVTGLREAHGEYIGWTHGDFQTPPEDTLRALAVFLTTPQPHTLYVKGRRRKRPLADAFFTWGMSIFESLLFMRVLVDINAQPNFFHRSFLNHWHNPPKDFSLDLYALREARRRGLTVVRFPVDFNKRFAGVSSWNISWKSKFKFIKRTITYSFALWRKKV